MQCEEIAAPSAGKKKSQENKRRNKDKVMAEADRKMSPLWGIFSPNLNLESICITASGLYFEWKKKYDGKTQDPNRGKKRHDWET